MLVAFLMLFLSDIIFIRSEQVLHTLKVISSAIKVVISPTSLSNNVNDLVIFVTFQTSIYVTNL